MKVTEKKSEGLKKEYQVVVSAADFEKKVDAKLDQIAKTAKIQGFRAGHAPKNLIKQKYRASVLGEVMEELVQTSSSDIIKENDLRPVMMPDIKITSFADGKDLEFSVSLENMPEIKLGNLKDLALTRLSAEVPAEEVDKALKYLANSRKETTKVEEDRVSKKGDTLMIDFVGSIDGVEFQGGKGSNYPLELGSGSFIPGYEDQLIGKKAGEKVEVKVTFPKDYHAKDLAGKEALFVTDIKEIRIAKEVEINDEFAKSLGEESLDKLKEMISGRIQKDYEQATRMKLKRELLDNLDKAYNFETPQSLVDTEFKGIVAQYEQAKKYNQLDASEKAKSEDELMKDYKDIAVRRVKLGLLLSEIGKDAKITVKPEDINEAIMNEANKYPGQEKAVLDYYLKNKQAVESLKAPVFEEKIIDYIVSQAKVTDKIVSVEELYKFDDEVKSDKTEKKASKAKSAKKDSEEVKEKAPKKCAKKAS